jgi:hypothetical protein
MNPSFLLGQSEILHRIDSGALSVVSILAVIGTFVLAVVVVVCITTTIQRIIAVRESNKLILELLNRGYSAEEIERVVYGNTKFGVKVGRFFRDARNVFRPKKDTRSPVPPVKTTEPNAGASA